MRQTEERTRPEEERLEKTRESSPSEATAERTSGGGHGFAFKLARYLVMPVILAAVLLILYLWINGLTLDSIEQRNLNADVLLQKFWRHMEITAVSTVLVVAVSVTAGVILTRPALKRVAPYIVAVASTGQALPSIGVIVLIAVLFGQFGFRIAVVSLIVYAFLPILRNTMVGIQQVDQSIIEAARGMGMTKRAVLFKIELPLSIPIMLAGIRTALIIVVGTATLATFINAGGLGDIINTGIKLNRDTILVTGALLTAVVALGVDYIAGIAEDVLKPKGL